MDDKTTQDIHGKASHDFFTMMAGSPKQDVLATVFVMAIKLAKACDINEEQAIKIVRNLWKTVKRDVRKSTPNAD